jgi:hypothetical protein
MDGTIERRSRLRALNLMGSRGPDHVHVIIDRSWKGHAMRRCIGWTGQCNRNRLLLCSLAVAAGLAACGGGGSDDGGPPGTVDVTLVNQNTLTRAALVTVQSGLVGGSLGLTASAQPGPQASRALGRVLLAGVRSGAAPRESIAGLISAQVRCGISGVVDFTLDDRDNSQGPSAGDVLSAIFSACSDVAGEVINGRMNATYTQAVPSPLTVGASVTLSDLSLTDGPRSVAASGAFAFTYPEPSASVATLRMVVGNSLVMRVTTPAFTDTVTMLDGYTIDTAEDFTAVPPGGGTPGRSTTTVTGKVSSTAAGGTVQVDTLNAIVQYADDDYPRAGRLGVTGKNGSLQATALSATEVRIETDVNGDGQFDASTTVPWTQLF